MSRGYFGIGIVRGKSADNVGGLWRSAHAFGASLIFTVEYRPPREPTDTTRASRHVPLVMFSDLEALMIGRPYGGQLVAVENGDHPERRLLPEFKHPERALYVLGSEDRGLGPAVLDICAADGGVVEIPSSLCLNVATAGSIVMYDRIAKAAA
jgi:tRNA G18 (ribose-2'-O)-methylase SpoU